MTTNQDSDSPVRILLVEDNDANRRLMQDYLEYAGYEVFGLAEGRLIGSAIADFNPQVIVLDLRLPDIDGFELLDQIRQTPEWQRIPLIVVSAYAFQRDRTRALELGARHYLVKPIRLQELIVLIQQEIAPPQAE
jgi:CheY-like chemotaxis protein